MRTFVIGALFLAGCSCGRSYETVFAAPLDGELRHPLAPGETFDPDDVPTRCFDDAHTLVVGPGVGCASLEALGVEDHECPSYTDRDRGGWRGSPLRIVRRGSLLVRLSVLPRCEGCPSGEHPDRPQVIRMFGYTLSEPTASCESCGDVLTIRAGDDVVGYARTNNVLGFATLEFDDTVELLLVGPETVFDVEACTVAPSPLMDDFITVCQPYCAACAMHATDCMRGCLDTAVRESAPCLGARTGLARCRTANGCDATCEAEAVRVEYECRAP